MAGKVKLYGFTGSNSVYTGRLCSSTRGSTTSSSSFPRPRTRPHAPARLRHDGRAGAEGRRRPRPGHALDRARARRAAPGQAAVSRRPGHAPRRPARRALGRGAAERDAADLLLRRPPRPRGVHERPRHRSRPGPPHDDAHDGARHHQARHRRAPRDRRGRPRGHRAAARAHGPDRRLDRRGRARRTRAQRRRLPDRRQRLGAAALRRSRAVHRGAPGRRRSRGASRPTTPATSAPSSPRSGWRSCAPPPTS